MQTVGTNLNTKVLDGVSERDLKITEKTLARVQINIRGLLQGEGE